MNESIKGAIIGAIITGVFGIIGTIIAAQMGQNQGVESTLNQLNSQVVSSVDGDNNTVNINNVDDFIAEYNNLYEENKALRKQNTKYIDDFSELEKKYNTLKILNDDTPIIELNDLALKVDGDSIPINSTNARAKIDGKEYFSREITEKLINENQSIKVKDNTLYIGKVIAEQASLFDQWVNYSYDYNFDSVKDSYGNTYANALYTYSDTEVTYSLENKFKYLKLVIAAVEGGSPDEMGIITIKCDGEVVYTSPEITILTKPFEIDIPIKKCSLLTITRGGSTYFKTIISDAIVYN